MRNVEKTNGTDQAASPSTSKQVEEAEIIPENTKPMVMLYSQKMKGLKDLLLAEKLNTHAISLHLTAQSQVQVGKKGRNEVDVCSRPKRARRD